MNNFALGLYSVVALIAAALLLLWLLRPNRQALLNLLLPLTLVASHGVLLSGGVIEMAGRYGYGGVIALFGFTLIFALSPILLEPIRRLQRLVRFATAVDFLTFRYRGRAVSLIASGGLVMVSLPLLQAQFIAANDLLEQLLGRYAVLATSTTVLLLALTCWLLLPRRRREARFAAMAIVGGGLVIATVLVALLVALPSFGGVSGLNSWVVSSGQQQVVHRTEDAYPLFVLFIAASIVLPGNFLVALSDRIKPSQVRQIAWSYPLLVLLVTMATLPIMWSGLASQLDSPLQGYLFALPQAAGNTPLSAFAALAIIATALLCSCSLSALLARMLINSAVLPTINFATINNLNGWISRRIVNLAIAISIGAAALASIGNNASLTDHYLVSFVGLAQFVPGLVAASYFPNIGRNGFLIGLALGLAVWLVGLFVPLIGGDTVLLALADGSGLNASLADWPRWALLAAVVNVSAATVVSALSTRSREERFFAHLCMVDNVYVPARVELAQHSVAEIQEALYCALGKAAEEELNAALTQLGLDRSEQRPAKLRQLRERLARELSLRLGHYAASRMLERALPISEQSLVAGAESREDLNRIESVLAVGSRELTGIASELNRLRVHHLELVEALPVGVVSIDDHGEILLWNRKMAELSGLNREQMVGASATELPTAWRSLIETVLASSHPTINSFPLADATPPRWFNLQRSRGAVNGDDEAPEQLLVVEEVTEAVRLTQQYIDRDRLASIGRFAAGVAHEIGNPVTNISLLAQDLRSELPCPLVDSATDQLLGQTQRITTIVQSLLRFSRGDSGAEQIETLNLHTIADEAVSLSPLDASGSRRAIVNSIDRSVELQADRHQLLQVLINLLRNADQASPTGAPVTLAGVTTASGYQLDVIDAGSGIPEPLLQRIYEPFITSKEPDQGTGLGLWVVYQLMRNIGGEITLFNNPAAGATARLLFPASPSLP